jgi:xylan 1,4-beta-xylosidase
VVVSTDNTNGSPRSPKIRGTIGLLELFLFSGCVTAAFGVTTTTITPTVEVNFGQVTSSGSPGIGFLSGLQDGKLLTSTLQEIKPTHWRIGTSPAMYFPGDSRWPSVYKTLNTAGVIPELMVSDAWGYSKTNPPYSNWAAWQSLVKQIADENTQHQVIYDIWNEPDLTWPGTRAQFFEAYVLAYRTLLAELGPNVIVGGPSLSSYDPAFITAFLTYCLENNVQVNFLSWHENNNYIENILAISSNLANARKLFERNPVYSLLSIKQLQLNEMVGPVVTNSPGGILAHLNQAELGGADAAIKACWSDTDGSSDCFNSTLDGLSTLTGALRSSWWAYQVYSEGLTSRAQVATGDQHMTVIASPARADGASAQVLISYCDPASVNAGLNILTNVALNGLTSLGFLSEAQSAHVQLLHLVDTGSASSMGLQIVGDEVLPIVNGTVSLSIRSMRPDDLYQIIITKH